MSFILANATTKSWMTAPAEGILLCNRRRHLLRCFLGKFVSTPLSHLTSLGGYRIFQRTRSLTSEAEQSHLGRMRPSDSLY